MPVCNDEETMITDVNCEESVTAEEEVSRCLTEKDIPGAVLNGRNPATLKLSELKQWLVCRNAPTKRRELDLIAR